MIELDLLIRGGTVVEGSGAPAFLADVGIAGDRIVEIGRIDVPAKQVIEADGLLVTPGFVDIHTHLDAQLAWDPAATSSCWHGVTSVVLGNCGVTFAPCRPDDRRVLAEMMESVEDIPADSIMEGLSWDWQSYGEYLDAVERMPKGVNVGGMVGHCAVRYYVMGDRSADLDAVATPEEIREMASLVEDALRAGALGFSTSRTFFHRVPDGRHVPGTFAARDEVLAIGDVLGAHGAGVFEVAPQGLFESTPADVRSMLSAADLAAMEDVGAEIEWMADISRRSGRPVTFALAQTDVLPDRYREVLRSVESQNAAAAILRPQTTVRGVGILFTLAGRTPFDATPSWQELMALPFELRVAGTTDPGMRQRLVDDANARGKDAFFATVFVMRPDDVRYDYSEADSLLAHARSRGESPVEAFLRLVQETNGDVVLNRPVLNHDMGAVRDLLAHPETILGLGDAGAHVGQIMDASLPTYFLSHWVRDVGLHPIEEGIRQLTSEPAELFGLAGRGILRRGAFGDVNVFDLDELAVTAPTIVHDFPGGASRFIQKSRGYHHTVVNGRVSMVAQDHTGVLNGRMLRGA